MAVDKGVADPKRLLIGGHSYGAFMTANLLAHTDLFQAGIARSGAYNRSLTPFGFQSEQRTYWEALDTYIEMSPFTHANRIDEPILLSGSLRPSRAMAALCAGWSCRWRSMATGPGSPSGTCCGSSFGGLTPM
jgi:esterase/lipase superfamily enzyme